MATARQATMTRPVPGRVGGAEVPAEIRAKCQVAGVTVTAAQWRALPIAARQRLSDMQVEHGVERETFAAWVRWLLRTFG